MSRTLSVEQISTLISQLPRSMFGKIDWRSTPKLVARIVKALINSKEGIVTLVSKASGVHNQTLYAVMRGKTPDGSKEWSELRKALTKMKCDWRGKPMKPEITQVSEVSEVSQTSVKPLKKQKSKLVGKQVSKQEQKFYDFETKELVVVTTVRFSIDGETLADLLNA